MSLQQLHNMIFWPTRPPPSFRSVTLTMVKRPWPKREAFLRSCGLATKWGEKGPNKLLDNVPLLALDSLSLEQKRKVIQGNKFAKLWARLRTTTPNMGTTCSAPKEAQQPFYQSCFKRECAGVVLSHVQQACFETVTEIKDEALGSSITVCLLELYFEATSSGQHFSKGS